MRTGWWRRNRIALVALVLAAAATVLVGIVVPLRSSGAVEQPPTVASGDTARFDGGTARLRIAALFHRDGDPGVDVPRGAMILAVVVDLVPSAAATSCDIALARRGSDKIDWDPVSSPERLRYGLSDETVHYCDVSGRGSRAIEQVFLVPRSVYRDVVLRVTVTTKAGSTIRDLLLPADPRSDLAS